MQAFIEDTWGRIERLQALNKELAEALEQVLDLCEGETNADMLAIIIPARDVLSRAKDS